MGLCTRSKFIEGTVIYSNKLRDLQVQTRKLEEDDQLIRTVTTAHCLVIRLVCNTAYDSGDQGRP